MAKRRKAEEKRRLRKERQRVVEPATEQATAVIGPDFAPDLSLDWKVDGERPPAGKGLAVAEDVLATFLWLHAARLTGEPITIFGRSGRKWGVADLLGVDPLGRIHLFELKRTKVTADVAGQLEQYLLSHLFQDASLLMDEWRESVQDLLGDGRDGLLVSLAAAHAGARADTQGRKAVAKMLRKDAPDRATQIKRPSVWSRTHEPEKVKLIVTAMLARACRKRRLGGDSCPTLEGLSHVAHDWRPRLDPAAALAARHPRLRSRAVVWLVGPRVDDSARERVRLWRRAGLDARWLELRVLALNRREGWELHVAREHAPHRAEVVRLATEWLADHPEDVLGCRVAQHFYAARPASDRDSRGKDLDGGGLLHTCRLTIDPPKGPPVEFECGGPPPRQLE